MRWREGEERCGRSDRRGIEFYSNFVVVRELTVLHHRHDGRVADHHSSKFNI